MIIDNTYFINKEISIPQSVAQPNTGTTSNVSKLNDFINMKEYDLLLAALGYEQYTELISQFNEDGTWVTDPVQKWVDLVDGKDEWRGLRFTIGTVKVSLIAYYVYFYFLGQDWKTYATTGIQNPEAENSTTVIPNDKQVNAWSRFIKMYGGNVYANSPTFFSNWNGYGMMWNGSANNGNQISLYEFLQKNDYDSSKFTVMQNVNQFNI